MFEECIDALVIERDHILDELIKLSNLLREINDDVRAFGYPHLLAEKVQSLA